jgi:Zinc knuckle
MQGHKSSDCAVKKQRMNMANGNKGENMKNNCFNCGKPGHYSKNCPERKPNPLGRQQKLFVGHVGEDCVYMAQEQKQAHKTNRYWHLDASLSDNNNNNMNMEEDSDASDTTRVASNNTNVNNNNNIISRDVDDTEEYVPTDLDNFEAKIPEIA